MRGKPKSKRYYYPWDPLQLSEEIDGPHIATKSQIEFEVFRTYQQRLKVAPLITKNMALFTPDEDQFTTLLTHLCKQSARKKFHEALTLEVYTFPGAPEVPDLHELDRRYYFLRHHPYEESLKHFLGEVAAHAATIKEKARAEGFIEPPNKKVAFLVLVLGPAQLEELKEPAVGRAFRHLLLEVDRQRIFPVVLAAASALFPRNLLGYFEVAAYLGNANETYATTVVYPTLKHAIGSFAQEPIGYIYHHAFRYSLLRCHPLIFTPSEWKVKRDDAYAEEERLYREYLASLRKEQS